MGNSSKHILAAGLLALASHAAAQVSKVCPITGNTDVCFQLNVPESTASSGNGDIFFQLTAPSEYEYVALGQGTGMSGANIFVVYTSGNGNVTLSPRLGTGQRMPLFNRNAQVTLLEGSGVSNGKMVANVRCSSCNSWSGGSASFSGNNGNWIYAVKRAGGPKDSSSQSETIDQHDDHDAFQWNYANAKGGNSVNPLLAAGGSGSGSGTASGGSGSSPTSCIPRPAGAAATGTATGASATSEATSTRSDDDDDDNGRGHHGRPTDFPSSWTRPTARPTGNSWGDFDARALAKDLSQRADLPYCDELNPSNSDITPISSGGSARNTRKMLIAHGTLAALAFVILFPFGAIAIRLASFTGVVLFHAAFQIFAYVVYIAAFGLGINIAHEYDLLSETHPIIGIVVLAALFFQPVFGFVHHRMYKKYQTRTAWSHIHLWLGRLAITLGIINGGLGMQLADRMRLSSRSGMIAYGVVAGVVWLAWVAATVVGERRRSRAMKDAPPKYTNREGGVSQVNAAHGVYAPKANGT